MLKRGRGAGKAQGSGGRVSGDVAEWVESASRGGRAANTGAVIVGGVASQPTSASALQRSVPEPQVCRGVVSGFGSERTTDALGDERRRSDEANQRARHRRDEGERGRVRDFQGNDIDRSSGGAFSLSR